MADEYEQPQSDSFVDVTHASWFGRLGNALSGVLVGVILFSAAIYLIFWNESRSVERMRALAEGKGQTVSVASTAVDPSHEGRLVHMSGPVSATDAVEDSLFGVKENALKLKRIVEMYQWKESEETETAKTLGGGETTTKRITYEKIWSDKYIPSNGFSHREGHQNPNPPPYQSAEFAARNVTIGAFRLSQAFVEQINHYDEYPLTEANVAAMGAEPRKYFALVGPSYVHGDLDKPQVGAVRVSFYRVKPEEMSVVGKQENGAVVPFETDHGAIRLIQRGELASKSMFKAAEEENSVETWILRLLAFALVWGGLALVISPLSVLADVVPLLGSIVAAGLGVMTGLAALIVTLVAVALAWLLVRPLIGGALLVICLGLIFAAYRRVSAKA